MPCCAIMLYDAGLAGCLAGAGRGSCAGVQAVWQLMTVSLQCAATCQLLVLTALFWCMLTPTRGWRDYSLCWHWSEQPTSGDLVNAQKQGACLSTYFLLQSGLTLLAVDSHTLLHTLDLYGRSLSSCTTHATACQRLELHICCNSLLLSESQLWILGSADSCAVVLISVKHR